MAQPRVGSFQRKALAVGAILAVCVALWCFWWLSPPTVFDIPGAQVSLDEGGGPSGTVTFIVRDVGGRPLPGIVVASQSYSGWANEEPTTDATGRAVIKPGEAEVIAVKVGHLTAEFRRGT